ncbi:MAG: hypothetical protein LBJ71_03815, partial [Holosporaceae bacterium]|nr:hypothetical protein [Holosporaceae bacterium]
KDGLVHDFTVVEAWFMLHIWTDGPTFAERVFSPSQCKKDTGFFADCTAGAILRLTGFANSRSSWERSDLPFRKQAVLNVIELYKTKGKIVGKDKAE